ncbi:hypothetical protein PLESTM_001061700, partial [Pleodorina starrii]
VGDTGLDVEHCAFADPRFNGSYQAALGSPTVAVLGIASYAQIREHRKVVQYTLAWVYPHWLMYLAARGGWLWMGGGCGVFFLAGAWLRGPGRGAPTARLSFIDTQGGRRRGGTMLWVPYDVYACTFRFTGKPAPSSPATRGALTAPGMRSMARFTVAAPPSLAKNVVAVFPWENYNLPTLASISTSRAQRPIPHGRGAPGGRLLAAPEPSRRGQGGSVVLALRGNGECDAAEQARNVAAAGAAALMIVQLPPYDPEDMGLTLIGFIYEGGQAQHHPPIVRGRLVPIDAKHGLQFQLLGANTR